MKERFTAFIEEHNLCDKSQEIMLAVSGGIDSVVLTDLFCLAGYSCILLHCNFGLRGNESDADEAFVRSLASYYEIPVFVKKFETENFAEEEGISVQMAARQLRYEWFEEISEQQGIKSVATAHNLNDSAETLLLNLSRGAGIKGLTGIPVKNGKFIRPILYASREEIQDYVRIHQLKFREDSSNASTKYQRNLIRHQIIPLFQEINPSFIKTMGNNIQRFSESYTIYRERVEEKKEEIFQYQNTHIKVPVSEIKKLNPIDSWLYELFSDYDFTMDQCLNIRKILDSPSGKQFISPTHRLFKDRHQLLLFKVSESAFERYYIDSPESNAALPFAMDMDMLDRSTLEEFPNDENTALLDLDKLQFPLMLRKWQHGDYFMPLGMEQMKKVSDFFIDNKVPVPVKKRTWLLTSGKKIVWIIGLRIDNRFKITESTRQILRLQFYS